MSWRQLTDEQLDTVQPISKHAARINEDGRVRAVVPLLLGRARIIEGDLFGIDLGF